MGGDLIPVDELGIDVCITSSQKCLGLPPGLAIASVSDKAIAKAETVENRGLYFDYLELVKFVKEKPYQYPSTPSLSHMFALDYQLDRILEEGIENRYKRHCEMAEIVRDWARKNCELYSDPDNLSVTVTCITNTTGLAFSDINKAMGERGYLMSNGYGPLKDKTFRIAHMADTTVDEIKQMLADLDEVIAELKAKAIYDLVKKPVISDDSGLSVDALGGDPGVFSHRFAGPTDQDRINKILTLLENVDDEKRTAHFTCAICFIDENGNEHIFEEKCEGTIARKQEGENGFGYDPIFLYEGKTFADISSEEKNEISHRGRAIKSFVNYIRNKNQ
jgi:non-canonical purine NTP pyrophosphatase (RdgB/HAM1 family)